MGHRADAACSSVTLMSQSLDSVAQLLLPRKYTEAIFPHFVHKTPFFCDEMTELGVHPYLCNTQIHCVSNMYWKTVDLYPCEEILRLGAITCREIRGLPTFR